MPTRTHAGLTATAGDRYGPLLDRLLASVAATVPEAAREDGTVVQWMWWPLTLRVRDGVRVEGPAGVCEPPDDLTTVLALTALQLHACRVVGEPPAGFDPEGTVQVAPGTLEAEAVMLARLPEAAEPATGWHLRPDGPLTPYEDDYETLDVAALLARRNGLLVPMALPSGLIVRMRGDDVVSVRRKDGTELWRP